MLRYINSHHLLSTFIKACILPYLTGQNIDEFGQSIKTFPFNTFQYHSNERIFNEKFTFLALLDIKAFGHCFCLALSKQE